jgi:hypothetical protein
MGYARFGSIVFALALAGCGGSDGQGFGSDTVPPSPGGGIGSSSNGSGGGDASTSGSGSGTGSGSGAGTDGGVVAAGDGGAVDDGGDYNTPTVCTSNQHWTLGDTASDQMHPGVACDTCHKIGGSATKFPFDVAGTVYPTAHEPDDCDGVTGAQVVITDANGTDHTLAVNAAGNFYNLDYVLIGAIPMPYTAKVVANGKVRPMISSQSNGDCNSCHSVQGTQLAPGRIMMP